jgi:hypothetical protein
MSIFRSFAPALAATIIAVACSSFPIPAPGTITITEARSDASALDGKDITVLGYITLEFENNSVWASPTDADQLSQSNCLGLVIPDEMRDNRLNGHWAVLRGILHVLPENTIYLNACSGVSLELLNKPVRIAKPRTTR